jgi:hypothetical protein
VLPIVVGAVIFFGNSRPAQVEAGNVQIALKAPASAGKGSASAYLPDSIASVLDTEAGISAYFQTASPIDLDDVRGLFHTIEIETSDYILGSVTVPGNWEDYDVHTYIHKSGWVLTYYLRDEPAVKIFDWQTYTGVMNPTRFQAVSNLVTATLLLPDPTLTYYDFRYPNATNLFLAVEDISGAKTGGSFDILDTSFIYHERSWMLGGSLGGTAGGLVSYVKYELDGTEIHRIAGDNITRYDTGFISVPQLPPDEPHTIYIYHHSDSGGFLMGALAIVYGPQP